MSISLESVLILSYYHPWIAGGGHRPRRLMSEDLLAEREICFLYVDPVDPDALGAMFQSEPIGHRLHIAHSEATGDLRFSSSSKRWKGLVSASTLLADFSPSYVRIHNPSEQHISISKLAKDFAIPILYDQMDLWEQFKAQPWGAGVEQWYLSNADKVSAVSKYLADLQSNREVAVIPNGVPLSFIEECRRQTTSTKSYDIVYAGALWPDWIDWKLIYDLVEHNPEWRWCFVGPLSSSPGEDHGINAVRLMEQLICRKNVTFVDEVEHGALARILTTARIGIVPFKRNPLTLAASPIKVYDYLAAALDVVCFDTPEVASLPRVIRCDSATDYVKAIKTLLDAEQQTRVPDAWMRSMSWTSRREELDRFVLHNACIEGTSK